jgi:hypothetical protein
MQALSAEKTTTICLIASMTIWMLEIMLKQMGKLTMHQFEASMLIPLAIQIYGFYVRRQARIHGHGS